MMTEFPEPPEIEQGSPEWLALRAGVITSSNLGKVMKRPKVKNANWTEGAFTYAYKLAAERVIGTPLESSGGAACEHGHDYEDVARAEYAMQSMVAVGEAGFVLHDLKFFGGSPDGYTRDDAAEDKFGIHEIKSPYNPVNQVRYSYEESIPDEYYWQCVGNMLVTGATWCDFVSFCPSFEVGTKGRLFTKRIHIGEVDSGDVLTRVAEFDAVVNQVAKHLRADVRS